MGTSRSCFYRSAHAATAACGVFGSILLATPLTCPVKAILHVACLRYPSRSTYSPDYQDRMSLSYFRDTLSEFRDPCCLCGGSYGVPSQGNCCRIRVHTTLRLQHKNRIQTHYTSQETFPSLPLPVASHSRDMASLQPSIASAVPVRRLLRFLQ